MLLPTKGKQSVFRLPQLTMLEKKHRKAICKLCEGVTLAHAGGTSNLFNHLEAKHPVAILEPGRARHLT